MGHYGYWSGEGIRLRYWEGGSGETVLFLHGGGLPASCFRENRALLSRLYRTIIPDLPGFGRSDFPGPGWSYADYARCLKAFLDDRGITVDHLIGYSLGGGMAVELAPLLPSLKGLVLLSPGVESFSFRHARLMTLIAAEAFGGLSHALRARRMGIYLRIAREFLFPFIRWPHLQYRILRVVMRSLLMNHDLEAVRVPTVVVSARGDRFFPPETGRRLAEKIPRAVFKLGSGIHLWVLLDHEKVGAYLPE